MYSYISLLRGINVGGHNKLPMSALTKLLSELGLSEIRTYIQSGNILFKSPQTNESELSARISDAIFSEFGFAPNVLVLNEETWLTVQRNNPFPYAETQPQTLHLYFLEQAASNPDLKKLETLKKENETFQLINQVLYLFAPDGIGRSKLAAGVEKALGVPVTARNWNTVTKISEMLEV